MGIAPWFRSVAACARTMHAGPLTGALPVDERVLAAMEEYAFLAPAHNPPYVAAMRAFRRKAPELPLVALFETAFFDRVAESATTYAVPWDWKEELGVRRYGFHGASHRAASERGQALLGRKDLRHVSCHLGGSSSLAAIRGGVAVGCSFGMSPQSGLPHNDRVGDLDVFAALYVMKKRGLGVDEMARAIGREVRYHEVSPEVYRSLGFPGADDMANMFQFKRDFNADFVGARSIELSRRLNPGLQDFDAWLASNDRYLACCWMGGSGDDAPTAGVFWAYEWLIREIRSRGAGSDVEPHMKFFGTDCPGRVLEDHCFTWRNLPGPAGTPPFPLPAGWYFGPRSGPRESVSGYYSHRADLARWQTQVKLGLVGDGLYGPLTAAAARHVQTAHGLAADSLIGPLTWNAAWS